MPVGQPSLAPFAHVRFCLEHPRECRTRRASASPVRLDARRLAELQHVNNSVNMRIVAQAKPTSPALGARWAIAPAAGDCNDYAVTKRRELIARGWPSSALLLAEAQTGWGEHHLVLVARTSQGDYVLDNLAGHVRLWSETGYRWVKRQSTGNPKLWVEVAGTP